MTNEQAKGIVTSMRLSHNPMENIYTIIGDKVHQLKSSDHLDLYDTIEVKEQKAHLIGKEEGKRHYRSEMKKLLEKIDLKSNSDSIKLGEKAYADIAQRLMPELKKAALTLLNAFFAGAPIVVRFHNDGDGSAGAISLYRAFTKLERTFYDEERRVGWQMNKGIGYTSESFYADRMLFESYRSVEKPIVIITDFGTSTESEDAIKQAQGKCDLIWLDHHVGYDKFPKKLIKHYINVLDFEGDSNFTAGLLTCMFSEVISGLDMDDLKEASLISDYSQYANFKDKSAIKNALILDFLTTKNDGYSKPKQMDAILTDKNKSLDTFTRASGTLEEALNTGIKNLRKYKTGSGINICVLDFSHIAKLNLEYPLPGRYSSKLQDHMESLNKGRTITIVHYGNYISVRVSRDISDLVNLLGIIDDMKKDSDGAISGGGHKQAASIKTTKEQIKETMHLFLMKLGVSTED